MTIIEENPITYNSLNEALLAGVSVTHVGNNGEYVEYITFEDGKYLIKRWVYGHCVSVKTFKGIESILTYRNKCQENYGNDLDEGTINKQYSLEEIKEELKKVVNIKIGDNSSYYILFAKEIDDHSDFHLRIKKYSYSNYSYKYTIEVSKIRSFCADKSVFARYAVNDEYYLQQCEVLINTLKDLNLLNDWYREFSVKIKYEDESQ